MISNVIYSNTTLHLECKWKKVIKDKVKKNLEIKAYAIFNWYGISWEEDICTLHEI